MIIWTLLASAGIRLTATDQHGQGVESASLLTSLFGVLTTTPPKALVSNKDDILFSHSHSGVDFNGYGGSHEGQIYAIGNDRAGAKLRVWARE